MAEKNVRRDIGVFALTMTGLGSIIGSGWLFGAWRTAQLAGVGAVYAWIVGAVIISCIAIVYAELGAMFPESGGSTRFGYYSHGALVGFIAGWAIWLSYVSVIGVEAEASVQYMASWPWRWAQDLYVNKSLTPSGLAIASVLVLAYFLINFWGVKLYARTNGAITTFKLIVPAATGVALIAAGYHPANFHVGMHGGGEAFNPSAVLTAVAASGIVFSFNGFQSPVNLAGEAKRPGRDVPVAVLGSIGLATIIYLLLQVAFIGATPPQLLTKGWAALDFSSPFAQLALALNLGWLAFLLYADAFVSPSGTGATYTAVSARMIYAMERSGALPGIVGGVHAKSGVPRRAMWFNLAVAFGFMFCFRGWGSLAAVISVACIISYISGPVSAAALRRTAPELGRPLKIPALAALAPVAFVLATLLLYWARWPLTGEVILLVLVAMPIYAWAEQKAGWPDFRRQLNAAWWLIAYLCGVALVSWLGSPVFGGTGLIPYGWDMVLVAMLGVIFYLWGERSGWRTPYVDQLERDPGSEPHI